MKVTLFFYRYKKVQKSPKKFMTLFRHFFLL